MKKSILSKVLLSTVLTFPSLSNAMEHLDYANPEAFPALAKKLETKTPDGIGANKRYPVGNFSIKMTAELIKKIQNPAYQPTQPEIESLLMCYNVAKNLLAHESAEYALKQNEVILEMSASGGYTFKTNAKFDRKLGTIKGYNFASGQKLVQSLNFLQLNKIYKLVQKNVDGTYLDQLTHQVESKTPDAGDTNQKRFAIGYQSILNTQTMYNKMKMNQSYIPTKDELTSFLICHTVGHRLMSQEYLRAINYEYSPLMDQSANGEFTFKTQAKYDRASDSLIGYEAVGEEWVKTKLSLEQICNAYLKVKHKFPTMEQHQEHLKQQQVVYDKPNEGKLVWRTGFGVTNNPATPQNGGELMRLLFVKQQTPQGEVMYAATNPATYTPQIAAQFLHVGSLTTDYVGGWAIQDGLTLPKHGSEFGSFYKNAEKSKVFDGKNDMTLFNGEKVHFQTTNTTAIFNGTSYPVVTVDRFFG